MPATLPFARLVVVQGDASRREVPLEGATVLGRSEECALVLLDGACSRRHAQVEPSGAAFVVTDLGSTNGTYVNGARIDRHRLEDGDEIGIGGVRIRYRAPVAAETFVVGAAPRRAADGAPAPTVTPTGKSQAVLSARALVERAARSDLPVLLRGETGTGKEVFARYLHARSARSSGPFVALHAAALPSSLFEAELFGHERGAFTGADARREGLLAKANGGTLFLDEVGELPVEAQVKLLRVLETGEYRPVGAVEARRSDFRLVAATNRDLERAVRDGAFRSDLLFRLNALSVTLPPLRARLDDLPEIAGEVLASTGKKLAATALAVLRERSWPGNVRELRNALERAALVADGDTIETEHLPPDDGVTVAAGAAVSMEEAERQAVVQALAATGGRRGDAARLLGISEPTLRRKLRRFGLERR